MLGCGGGLELCVRLLAGKFRGTAGLDSEESAGAGAGERTREVGLRGRVKAWLRNWEK